MEKDFIIHESLLSQLTEDVNVINIILGTGALARDMQRKLRLLNLKVPFLIGGYDDPENGIRHYNTLTELGDLQHHRFISCFNIDEYPLIAPTHSMVYKVLGVATENHPKVIRFSGHLIRKKAGVYSIDSHIQECLVKDGNPYVVFGDINDNKAYVIHIYSGCIASGIFNHAENTIPKLLYDKLQNDGYNVIIYSWGQPSQPVSDSLIFYLRDGYHHKPDHVILFVNSADLDPINANKKNTLNVRTKYRTHPAVRKIRSTYPGIVNEGIDYDVDELTIGLTQSKILSSMSKLQGFTLWNVFPPNSMTLSEEQSHRLLKLSPGFLARARKRKDEMIEVLSDLSVKDYTDTFDEVPDIFDMFVDIRHYTSGGNDLIAQRLADDLISEHFS